MAKQDSVRAKNVSDEDRKFLEQNSEGLSDTATKYGKWINSTGEHEDRPGQSLVTRSHEVIRQWAQERGAKPATVPGTEHDDRAGVLRFNFPDYGGESLAEISWDEWFETFDARNLVFLFQEHKGDGDQSNFFQLDSPQRSDA